MYYNQAYTSKGDAEDIKALCAQPLQTGQNHSEVGGLVSAGLLVSGCVQTTEMEGQHWAVG